MAVGDPFVRLWAGVAVSNLGDGVGMVAVPLLAASLTRDPVLVSTVAAVAFVPYLLLSLPLGVVVDRVDRRWAMVSANLVRVAALVGLVVLVATDTATVWWLMLAAFVIAAGECVYDLAAETILIDVVAPERLDGANSRLQTTMYVTNMFVGGPLGAALFALAAVAPFGTQAVGHLVAAGFVMGVPTSEARGVGDNVGAGRALRDGVSWLVGHPSLRSLAAVTALVAFGQQAAQATVVLFVLDALDASQLTFGILTMVSAVGAIVGSTAAPALASRWGRRRAMGAAIGLLPLTMAGIGVAPNAVVVGAVLLGFSGAIGLWNVLSVSLRQELVPSAMAGRVFGAWRTLVMGALPVGAWVGGAIAARWGLRSPWLVGAGLSVVAAAMAWSALTAGTDPQPPARGSSAVTS